MPDYDGLNRNERLYAEGAADAEKGIKARLKNSHYRLGYESQLLLASLKKG